MAEITRYVVRETSLTAVANAIRTRGGTSGALKFPDGFVYAIEHIYGGVPNMADLTIVPYGSYEPIITYGKFVYQSQKYICYAL